MNRKAAKIITQNSIKMSPYTKLSGICFLLCVCLISCTANENKSSTDSTAQSNFSDNNVTIVESLTNSEAKSLMHSFLQKQGAYYEEYGEIEDVYLASGNYNDDGVLDFFYTIDFYPGGDFIYPTHFFYDSKTDKIQELKMSKSIDFIRSIDVKEIKTEKLIADAFIWNALSGEHVASRSIKAEFKLKGNEITCEENYLPAFQKALIDIEQELHQMELELSQQFNNENGTD